MNEFKLKVLKFLNIKEEELPFYIKDVTYDDIESPYAFLNMEKAKGRILKAIANKEKIMIYGDYDVDGFSATSIMVKMFEYLGVKVGYYIPSRYIDGYGININRAKQIKSKGYNLVITVDNGVSQHEALSYLKDNDIDVILTDHHEILRELPPCYTIIHPELKNDNSFNKQCGAYVAFMLSIAVLGKIDDYLLTLAAMATISDMMPLLSYNRDIVKLALKIIKNDKSHLFYLIDGTNNPIDEQSFGFNIVPKINSIGRIKEDTSINDIVKLLVSNDKKIINSIILEANTVNDLRKKITLDVANSIDYDKYENEKIIVEKFDGISEGIIGLIAGRVLEKCNKPCILLTTIHEPGMLKGSARSFKSFPIAKLFEELSSYLLSYGGHAQAGGLSLKEENFEAFKLAVNHYAKNKVIEVPEKEHISLSLDELTYENYMFLKALGPFGTDFPSPLFEIKCPRNYIIKIGKEGNHISGLINKECRLIGFNMANLLSDTKFVTFRGNMIIDNFNKGNCIQFKISEVVS